MHGASVIPVALFQELLNAAPDPIVIVDGQGKIAAVNAETEAKFGFERDEMLGKPIELLIPERYRGLHSGQRQTYTDGPRTRPMGAGLDLYARRKDGSEFPVEISLSPSRTERGLYVISIIRDISERKRAERELKAKAEELTRSNAELEQFAYVASHDLQEPLRAIAGACQLLQKRYASKIDATADEFIHYAVDGAKRMQELIDDLLDYSRVSTKTREFQKTDCNEVMRRVLANLSAVIDEAQAEIKVEALPIVRADTPQLIHLFQNLLSNALKFHGTQRSQVLVGARRDGSHWLFSVKDNGIGIAPQHYNKVFDIFKRLHSRDKYPGTGIGLATCKKIVEHHGGKIWVESTPGAGSTFYFTIPAREEAHL